MRTPNEILREIDQLPGMDEFKALCKRIHTAADNAGRLLPGKAPLPNLIFSAAPGCGVTLHIRLLSELLGSLRLLQFTGEEEFFEWSLGNGPHAVDRLLLRVKAASGFYGQFRGVIGLDISDAIRHGDTLPDTERLMEFVNANQGRIVFVFVVPDHVSSRTLRELLGCFASITPAEVIHMPFPTGEAKSFVARKLKERGFRLTKKAAARLEEAVTQMSTSKEFEGYRTLDNLADAIIWHRLCSDTMKTPTIGEADLGFIFAENGYFSQLNASSSNAGKRRVGFGTTKEGC